MVPNVVTTLVRGCRTCSSDADHGGAEFIGAVNSLQPAVAPAAAETSSPLSPTTLPTSSQPISTALSAT